MWSQLAADVEPASCKDEVEEMQPVVGGLLGAPLEPTQAGCHTQCRLAARAESQLDTRAQSRTRCPAHRECREGPLAVVARVEQLDHPALRAHAEHEALLVEGHGGQAGGVEEALALGRAQVPEAHLGQADWCARTGACQG
jgi:hypothetical protein